MTLLHCFNADPLRSDPSIADWLFEDTTVHIEEPTVPKEEQYGDQLLQSTMATIPQKRSKETIKNIGK